MRRMILLAAMAALSACATTPSPRPAVDLRVIHDQVMVPVPCVNAGDIAPEPPHVASELTGAAKHDLEVVDRSALELRTWGNGLRVQLLACSNGGAQPRK